MYIMIFQRVLVARTTRKRVVEASLFFETGFKFSYTFFFASLLVAIILNAFYHICDELGTTRCDWLKM